MTSISLINIGSELLNGRIVNTNATKIGDMLREAGYQLSRVVMIPDQPDAIRATVEAEWERHEVVLISGGLGPTKDDLTKHLLAEWWGTSLELHPPTLDFLHQRYRERGRTMNPLTEAQALVPVGAEVLPNAVGTAPGLSFARQGKWLVAMPGVPFELLTMMEAEVLPRLKLRFAGEVLLKSVLRLTQVSESEVAILLADLEESLPPGISIAYLPRTDGLWLELKAVTSPQKVESDRAILASLSEAIRGRCGHQVYADNDLPLPQLLGEALLRSQATIAVAESLTGGSLAARIVSVSGASRYFLGSVTAYTVEAKVAMLGVDPALIEAHGVVSAEVARAMAEGIRQRFGATYALSTTGWAEQPDTNTEPGAWIGFAGPRGSEAQWLHHYYRRAVNMERTAEQALALALEKVKEALE